MTVAVALCLCALLFSGQIVEALGGPGVTMEYESKLFDTSNVLEVNILMDEAQWQALLDNAMSEEYVTCDVEIAGETFYNVGIRPKGNTSLSSIAMDPTTDRYSLKLEFDQYVEGQTCFGLDKLILNNSYADTTYMKEALIYDLFHYVDADASLYNFAKISVNGEYWGLYLALEAVEDSFLLRNYGTANGELYKPDSMNMGSGREGALPVAEKATEAARQTPAFGQAKRDQRLGVNEGKGESDVAISPPEGGEMPEMGDFDPSEMFGGGGFGGGMFGNGGSNLNYSDDDLGSYSTIWDGEVTASSKNDHQRVVTALKNIFAGTNLEQYMDIDNLVNYMAVHIFSENDDSLSGSMAHNYYLYESSGQLNILPWDYNLAFGGMGMGRSSGATDMVNGAIDDAWSGTNFFDTLLADETYHAAYYEAMAKVVEYFRDGSFDAFYNRTREQIDALVEADPNAFYTYAEYLTGVETLYEAATLRAQSIDGQLKGTIPSTDVQQRNSDARIDASHIDLSVLGSMSMGGGGGERGFDFAAPDAQAEEGLVDPTAFQTGENSTMPQFGGQMPEGFDPSQFGGEMPAGLDPSQFSSQMPGGVEQPGNTEQAPAQTDPADGASSATADPQGQTRPDMGNMPDFGAMSNGNDSGQSNLEALMIYGISAAVLLAAFLLALLYGRRPRKR